MGRTANKKVGKSNADGEKWHSLQRRDERAKTQG